MTTPRAPDFGDTLRDAARASAAAAASRSLTRAFNSPSASMGGAEWAERWRHLPKETSAMPGRWRNAVTPYLREVQDVLADADINHQVVALMKGGQLGNTRAAENSIGRRIHVDPGPILYMTETASKARQWVKEHLRPMLALPPFRGLVGLPRGGNTPSGKKDSTLAYVEFPGGSLTVAGGQSSNEYSSRSFKYVVADEFARYPRDVDSEGDPVSLLRTRVSTYGAAGKVFVPSTPIDESIDEPGAFSTLYEMGDQRYYFVPCPHCDAPTVLNHEHFFYRRSKTGFLGFMRCGSCGEPFDESFKPAALPQGVWRATAERQASYVISYHLPSFIAPLGWRPWNQIAEDWHLAKSGRYELKPLFNLTFGRGYSEDSRTPEPGGLREKFERPYDRGTVPQGAPVLTVAIDVQRKYLDWEVKAWGPNMHNYSVDRGTLPVEMGTDECLRQVRELMARKFPTSEGGELPITMGMIDSGDQASHVYGLCLNFEQPVVSHNGVHVVHQQTLAPCKGSSMASTDKIVMRRSNLGSKFRQLSLWILGTDVAKHELYRALSSESSEDVFGKTHFPLGYPDTHYDEIVSEKLRRERSAKTGKTSVVFYKPPSKRNEALDLHVYNRAAADMLGLHRQPESFWRRAMRAAASNPLKSPDLEKRAQLRPRKKARNPLHY